MTLLPQPAVSALGDQLSCGLALGRQARLLGHVGVQVSIALPPLLVTALDQSGQVTLTWFPHPLEQTAGVRGDTGGGVSYHSPRAPSSGSACFGQASVIPYGCVSADSWFLKSRDALWWQVGVMDVDAEREKIAKEIEELERILDPSSSSISVEVSESGLALDSEAGELS